MERWIRLRVAVGALLLVYFGSPIASNYNPESEEIWGPAPGGCRAEESLELCTSADVNAINYLTRLDVKSDPVNEQTEPACRGDEIGKFCPDTCRAGKYDTRQQSLPDSKIGARCSQLRHADTALENKTGSLRDGESSHKQRHGDADIESSFSRSTRTTKGEDYRVTGRDDQQDPMLLQGKTDQGEWIVRFRQYQHAAQLRQALLEALGQEESATWQWVERHNPASAYPTDFGLLRMSSENEAALMSKLSKLAFVKDVHREMKHSRSLMEEVASDQTAKKTGRRGKDKGSKGCAGDCRRRPSADSAGRRRSQANSQPKDAGPSEDGGKHDPRGPVSKPPGRMRTKLSFGSDEEEEMVPKFGKGPAGLGPFWGNYSKAGHGRELLHQRSQITSMFEAEKLWAKGFSGAKVRMAVFDTGVRADHPHFRNIKERTNWTSEDTLNDSLGHGTFVAGVISSQDQQCLGFAPDVEIYAFRVFTNAQVSYTSWFLDAFNYAIATKMNILNLSIGGPDYMDRPFVEKVWEMTANNIIMVSAIGNDGPLYGTLNNPADQSDVIGVGGIDYSEHIASFSSRGMSTWELPHGYGRVKPDIVAYGREVMGSKISQGCKSLSGTSVASPVVAGAVCLLASCVPAARRWEVLNPASMKQALTEGATKLEGPNMFEQGMGRLNLLGAYSVLANYEPRASVLPAALDLTACPYAWPFCRQPLYAGSMPLIVNATILNGMGVVGWLESPPLWSAAPGSKGGELLDLQFTWSDVIWPWTGYLGIYLRLKAEGATFEGIIEGNITFTVASPPGKGELAHRRWECSLPLKVAAIRPPPRERRVLFDQFHNVRYPPGYIPRDSLDVRSDILDWHGDHLHTNYHGLFDHLRDAGFYVEILGSPLTCFDAKNYGTLLLVDLEDEYYEEEVEKLREDVEERGLGLVVFADWYHIDTMVKMRFFDDNTRSWWTPATGGSNIPALNDLLEPFGIAFGDNILTGTFSIAGERAHYASGTDIRSFPAHGFVHRFLFQDATRDQGIISSRTAVKAQAEATILGLTPAGKGRIAVYGDSNCLDSSHMVAHCYWLLEKLLNYTSFKKEDPALFPSANELQVPHGSSGAALPLRRDDVNFTEYSRVLGKELLCGLDTPRKVQNGPGYIPKSFVRGKWRQIPIMKQKSGQSPQAEETVSLVAPLEGSSEEAQMAGKMAGTELNAVGADLTLRGKVAVDVAQLGTITARQKDLIMGSADAVSTLQQGESEGAGAVKQRAVGGSALNSSLEGSGGQGAGSLRDRSLVAPGDEELKPHGAVNGPHDGGGRVHKKPIEGVRGAQEQERGVDREELGVDSAVSAEEGNRQVTGGEGGDRQMSQGGWVDHQSLGEMARDKRLPGSDGEVGEVDKHVRTDQEMEKEGGKGAAKTESGQRGAAKSTKSVDELLGWTHRTSRASQELDASLTTYQWLIPSGLCCLGFLLIWSLCRVRQRRRRRSRSRSGFSILSRFFLVP